MGWEGWRGYIMNFNRQNKIILKARISDGVIHSSVSSHNNTDFFFEQERQTTEVHLLADNSETPKLDIQCKK